MDLQRSSNISEIIVFEHYGCKTLWNYFPKLNHFNKSSNFIIFKGQNVSVSIKWIIF